jgi:hypothetical protein
VVPAVVPAAKAGETAMADTASTLAEASNRMVLVIFLSNRFA